MQIKQKLSLIIYLSFMIEIERRRESIKFTFYLLFCFTSKNLSNPSYRSSEHMKSIQTSFDCCCVVV